MDDRPIFLLDVDGVINCSPSQVFPRENRPKYHECISYKADGYRVTARLRVLEFIRRLHANDTVEFRWLTSWGESANVFLTTQLGLPAFKVAAEMNSYPVGYLWWKLDVVQALIHDEPGRPIVWVDDEISSDLMAVDFIARQQEIDIRRMLAIAPDEAYGLSDEQIDMIERFLA